MCSRAVHRPLSLIRHAKGSFAEIARGFYETAVEIKRLFVFSFMMFLLLSIGLLLGFLSDFYPHSKMALLNPVPVGVR